MSRIGKQEILIPDGVKVTQNVSQGGNTFTIAGPKGTLSKNFRDDIIIAVTDKTINLNI